MRALVCGCVCVHPEKKTFVSKENLVCVPLVASKLPEDQAFGVHPALRQQVHQVRASFLAFFAVLF